MLDRKALFKSTLEKSAHAFKRVDELNLTCRSLIKVLNYVMIPEELSHDLQFRFYFLRGYNCYIVDEEATKLRFFIDEPTYTDLHWVNSILYLNWFCLW